MVNMTQEKGYPKTSLPSVQDYIDAFRPALENGMGILCHAPADFQITQITYHEMNPGIGLCFFNICSRFL